MPSTTIHVPPELLEQVDARAKSRGVSRNRFILRALERALRDEDQWSPGFLAEIRRPLPAGDAEAVDEMLMEVVTRRSRKDPPPL